MTAAQLLAIPLDRPDRLFTGDDEQDRDLLRQFQAQWHPDRHGGSKEASDCFAHVGALYAKREEQLRTRTWRGRGLLEITLQSGATLRVRYRRFLMSELGSVVIAREHVCFQVCAAHKALFDNGAETILNLPFANDKMRVAMTPYLPHISKRMPLKDGYTLVVHKPVDLIRLRDLLDYFGGALPAEHVAWVISRLENLACYLGYAGLAHNAIDLDSVYVSPEHHSAVLLGGWWYAAPFGAPMTHLPASTAATWRALPARVTTAKRAVNTLDLESIRAVGRELLGDAGGTRLLRDPKVPREFARWLTFPARATAVKDYLSWTEARDQAFPRKFVPLPVRASDVY